MTRTRPLTITAARFHQSGRDWHNPAAPMTAWQRERRDGPVSTWAKVRRAWPDRSHIALAVATAVGAVSLLLWGCVV